MLHDRFYGIAAEEIARQEVDKDLFARAFAMALGDPEKTKAIYITIRAERLEELAGEMAAVRAKEEVERKNREREMAAMRAKEETERKKREAELAKLRPVLLLGHEFQGGHCRICGAVEKSVRLFRTSCCGRR